MAEQVYQTPTRAPLSHAQAAAVADRLAAQPDRAAAVAVEQALTAAPKQQEAESIQAVAGVVVALPVEQREMAALVAPAWSSSAFVPHKQLTLSKGNEHGSRSTHRGRHRP